MKIILEILDQEKTDLTAQHIHVQREVPGFMPLVVERIFNPPPAPPGARAHLSVAHYYLQNGDLVSDPEVTFSVYHLSEHAGLRSLGIAVADRASSEWLFIPTSVSMPTVGQYHEAFSGRSEALLVSRTWQRETCSFCDLWNRNLREQGFACKM